MKGLWQRLEQRDEDVVLGLLDLNRRLRKIEVLEKPATPKKVKAPKKTNEQAEGD
jgi:hypothetical protein